MFSLTTTATAWAFHIISHGKAKFWRALSRYVDLYDNAIFRVRSELTSNCRLLIVIQAEGGAPSCSFSSSAPRWGNLHVCSVGEVVGPPYSLESVAPGSGAITGATASTVRLHNRRPHSRHISYCTSSSYYIRCCFLNISCCAVLLLQALSKSDLIPSTLSLKLLGVQFVSPLQSVSQQYFLQTVCPRNVVAARNKEIHKH